MKKRIALVIYIGMLCILIGCQKTESEQENYLKRWITKANLDAEEDKDELYQKALEESGLVVYSNTSRVAQVKQSFEKEYPGLVITVYDMRTGSIPDKLKENYENGQFDCDVVLCSDSTGIISHEFLPKGILTNYVPYDIKSKMRKGHYEEQLVFLGESQMIFYNSALHDKPPIENWWQLTEDNYKGKIVMSNPLTSYGTYGLLISFEAYASQMEEAYEKYFGTPLPVPEGSNAGKIFLEALLKNTIIVNSSDEVIAELSGETKDSETIGIMVSSKMRMKELGYPIDICYQAEPFAGIYCPDSVFIASGAKNVSTAKLFIRWLLGEADGQGEGAAPYLTEGTWSTRTDRDSACKYSLDELELKGIDTEFAYEKVEEFENWYKEQMEGRE